MRYQLPPGMTHQQFGQSPQGQQYTQQSAAFFGQPAITSPPAPSAQPMHGAGWGSREPASFRSGQAQPIQSQSAGTPYGQSISRAFPSGSGMRPVTQSPTRPRQPTVQAPTTPYPNYPKPPRNPNDREGIAAWTAFYGTAPVFQRLAPPRPAPYGSAPRAPQTFVTTAPGAGPGRGNTEPRQNATTWGDANSGAWATTEDDAEYFVGSATDPENEAWNAQQAQQAQQQRDQLIRHQSQFNAMQQANRAAQPAVRQSPSAMRVIRR